MLCQWGIGQAKVLLQGLHRQFSAKQHAQSSSGAANLEAKDAPLGAHAGKAGLQT